ncbi:hypothetical protein NYE24_00565 [Paenibacillus sp. FSL H7-0350]|uniref:hypothetical protein n=1 Tax=Paenibacillus sp. FSL H7-0350 TaxID=2975345 RepID=UPI00315901CB
MRNAKRYANSYFNHDATNIIWRSLNSNTDIERITNGCKNLIKHMSTQYKAHELQREDIEEMERELGKYEIALDRISEHPQLFTFSEEEQVTFNEQFEILSDKVNKINVKKIFWD